MNVVDIADREGLGGACHVCAQGPLIRAYNWKHPYVASDRGAPWEVLEASFITPFFVLCESCNLRLVHDLKGVKLLLSFRGPIHQAWHQAY